MGCIKAYKAIKSKGVDKVAYKKFEELSKKAGNRQRVNPQKSCLNLLGWSCIYMPAIKMGILEIKQS